MAGAQAQYKDRLFSFLFGSEEHRDWTLSLYNAVNNTHYDNPDDISIETLRQVLYLGMHNDVAFIIADILSLYEQQSTFNPNMPLRMLEYTVNLFEKHIRRTGANKYGHRQIMLPVPKLVVFYNGAEDEPDERVLSLSDAFSCEHGNISDISVRVRMINVNIGHNQKLLDSCQALNEYAWIVDNIRALKPVLGLENAIDQTIESLPSQALTRPYLEAHKAEVKDMLLTEYNEAEAMELFKAEGRAEGREDERVNNIRSLMDSLKITARQAMDALRIPADEQDRYMKSL